MKDWNTNNKKITGKASISDTIAKDKPSGDATTEPAGEPAGNEEEELPEEPDDPDDMSIPIDPRKLLR